MRLQLVLAALGIIVAGCRPAAEATPRALPAPSSPLPAPSVAAVPSPGPSPLPSPPAATTNAPTSAVPPTSVPSATSAAPALPTPSGSVDGPAQSPTPTASPPRLIIGSLQLDRPVVAVPIRGGSWDLTGLNDDVGWLETTGQKPGDALAMALVGHITLTAVRRGPFADLWKLPVDAEVIYRQGSVDYSYAVKYKVSASPDEAWRLYVHDGQTLLLVTCSEWDYTTFSYAKRLIVVARFSGQTPAP